ncbi:hypothetical protein [Hymenobacter siberiensis]|uniref:hypothetical protein n=1 Tax=Hymenobacter siberiensis TaxID=2848396 RepID=UPI001C1DDFC2|nr:hypothetical protein [Hymenobacter siberiensis]
MQRLFSSWNLPVATRRAGLALAAGALAMGFGGCKNTVEALPDAGLGYYPVAVGNYWIYAVSDTTWSRANGQGSQVTPSVPTVSAFQFKETIASAFADAAGKTSYRLVRSKRLTAAAAWVDDSVFTLSPSAQSVILNRDNRRTLELIFPVREGRLWNFNAYNNNSADTVTAETRRYRRVGEPFSTAANGTSKTYPATATTTNEGLAQADDAYYVNTYQQVFAKGVGPVFRRKRRFSNFYYVGSGGNVVFVPKSYTFGYSRRETLIEYKVN